MRDRGAIVTVIPGKHFGMIQPGNINLRGRPVVHHKDGSISTERSFSISTGHGETLIPQVVHGRIVPMHEAIRHFQRTGEHLGVFLSPADADRYAIRLHRHQARAYGR